MNKDTLDGHEQRAMSNRHGMYISTVRTYARGILNTLTQSVKGTCNNRKLELYVQKLHTHTYVCTYILSTAMYVKYIRMYLGVYYNMLRTYVCTYTCTYMYVCTVYALIFAGLNFRGLPIFAVFMHFYFRGL